MSVKIMKHIVGVLLIVLLVVYVYSCAKQEQSLGSSPTLQVDISDNSYDIMYPDSILLLDSYDLSEMDTDEDNQLVLLMHNYRTNCFDLVNITSQSYIKSIPIQRIGPNGIPGDISWVHHISSNEILIFDNIKLYEIDSLGQILSSWELPDASRSIVNRNARANMGNMYHDSETAMILYPVATEDGVYIVSYSLADRKVKDRLLLVQNVPLDNYGFFRYPNVEINDNHIIFNYSFSSTFCVIDRATNIKISHMVPISPLFPQWKNRGASMDDDIWSAFENAIFYNLHYIESVNLYVQVVAGPTWNQNRQDLVSAPYNRPFYLRVFNPSFSKYRDIALPLQRYDPFCGWFTTTRGMGFYLLPDNTDSILTENVISLKIFNLSESLN